MRIGFIGMGNMARAIVEGWLRAGTVCAEDVGAVAKRFDRLNAYARETGICAMHSVREVAEWADMIVIAVKPDTVEQVIVECGCEKPILSVADGWTCEKYLSVLGKGARVQHILPNTPCRVGEGVMLFEEKNTLLPDERAAAERLFGAIGAVETLPAEKMGAATAIAGCGPAFLAMAIEALADAGVKYGLPRAAAYRLASQTLVGTGRLQLETNLHPGEIKDQVCSPGGSTIRGVEALENEGLRRALIAAVKAVVEG